MTNDEFLPSNARRSGIRPAFAKGYGAVRSFRTGTIKPNQTKSDQK
jgi:hypothetical protein